MAMGFLDIVAAFEPANGFNFVRLRDADARLKAMRLSDRANRAIADALVRYLRWCLPGSRP